MLAAAVVLGCELGSLTAYANLLRAGAYTSSLPALAAQLLRTVFWARYRPCPPPQGPLPFLSVIIPAYGPFNLINISGDFSV